MFSLTAGSFSKGNWLVMYRMTRCLMGVGGWRYFTEFLVSRQETDRTSVVRRAVPETSQSGFSEPETPVIGIRDVCQVSIYSGDDQKLQIDI